MSDELLEITMLGGLRIRRGGQPIKEPSLRKALALFAYLAVTGQAHTREELADLLWDEPGPTEGLHNLRTVLTSLRATLAPYLITSHNRIGFNTAQPHWLDVAALDAHLAAAGAAGGPGRARGAARPAPALAELEAAVALYTGPFLQGFYVRESSNFENWMLQEQERLERRIIGALHDLVQAALEQGAYAAGIAHATRLVQLDPLQEETHRHLMQLLALNDQRSAALEQYTACRRILLDELGIAPATATTDLYQRILAGELQPPSAVASGPGAAPAQRVSRPEHLPVQLTSFVGRSAELAAIAARLADPACRLLTLIGLGGSGKTRLAIQAAPTLSGFADGIYFVPLAPVADPTFLVSALTDALGYTLAGAQDPQTQLLAYVRDKELLLVLDSFEHLLDGAGLLVALMQTAPGVKLLVTSREPLDLAAEQIYDLAGLAAPPPSGQGVGGNGQGSEVGDYPAVQLFVQRAQRVQPQFALSPQVTPWVVRICRLVEGLPLGLELAASGVRGQACQAIAEELAHNIDVLATTQRDVPARHRSLRAVFDQSWQRLTAAEQVMFQRLAVFRGGFDEAAARAVVGEGGAGRGVPDGPPLGAWARSMLPALVQQGLLRHTPAGRYELHELLRQYAADKLAQAPEDALTVQARHRAYYLALAETAATHLRGAGPEGTPEHWLARLEQEHDNLRAALGVARADDDEDTGLRLAAALGAFWQVHGHLGEGRQWITAALAAAPQAPAARRGRARRGLGVLARQQGDIAEAITQLTASLGLARSADDPHELGLVLAELGQTHRLRGDYAQARATLDEGLAALRAAGDRAGMADTLINLGLVAFGQGDFPAARALYAEGLALQREVGDTPGIANTLLQLGNLAYFQGEGAAAQTLYEEALVLDREVGDKQGIAQALHNLGMLAQDRGDYAAAEALLKEDMVLFREMGHKPGLAHSLYTQGKGAYAQGYYTQARALLEESLILWREVGNMQALAYALAERGLVLYRQGDLAPAAASLRESLALCRRQQDRHRAALCLLGLASVAVARDPGVAGAERAARLVGEALGLLAAIGGSLEPAYRSLYEQVLEEGRATLGEAAFAAARAAGRAVPWEQAIADALDESAEA